jgi:hypothetical protein
LTGRLHHEAGFVFFLVAMVMLWPVVVRLRKSEKPRGVQNSAA